jgi:hypothetical protein
VIRRPLARLFPARPVTRPAFGPAPRRRAARRALVWAAAAVFLTHLALAVAVETSLPHLRDPQYGHRQYRAAELQRAHPDRPLVLVLGSSRTVGAIDPAAMGFPNRPGAPLVFNAGMAGAGPLHMRLNYLRYRAAGVRPAAVLVELLPAALSRADWVEVMRTESAPRLSAADLWRLGPYLDNPLPLYGRWMLGRANSWSALRWVVIGNLAPEWQPSRLDDPSRRGIDEFGFTPYGYATVSDEQRRRNLEQTAAGGARRNTARIAVSDLTARATRDLVADCRAAGTPVAFFLTPESPEYRSWYTPESRAALAAYARALSGEPGGPVFDAPADYAEDDFADGHHLLRATAARYSRWLADAHLKPWLAEALK